MVTKIFSLYFRRKPALRICINNLYYGTAAAVKDLQLSHSLAIR
jgi:hypothetical protein